MMGRQKAPLEIGRQTNNADAEIKPPLNPYWVLLIAILLPGVGQVVNNTPKRGVMFVFFIMSLGWVTMHLAPPEASFVGRYAGGFFIYAISIADAYRWARYRWEFFRTHHGAKTGPAS
jgi:hypothetical protein